MRYTPALISAGEFVSGWAAPPVCDYQTLDGEKERLDKALAHLTTTRVQYDTSGKEWDLTAIRQELDTRFADSVSLITGALPAQFGFRTTGVIDIHTKNGALFQQGEASLYVGSFDTIKQSLEYGDLFGKLA